MSSTLAYTASAIVALWGLAHTIPTRRVLAGFEPITTDNRRVVLQERLAEALAMWGYAALVITVTVTPVVWFKICPVVMVGSAALLVVASLL